ncbi:methyltransferase domain-containing protein [Microbispora rosea]|uniref:methyltransferase domain-containing protein n=1 Tax=Microbispora rosea TaxID=58117 RepID=UPI0037B3D5F5
MEEVAGAVTAPVARDPGGRQQRSRHPGLEFRRADACDLPFGGGELTGYRADKVYHALADPARAAAEAWRVLAPGGRIVLVGQDWDTFVIDSDDPALTRVMVHVRAKAVPSPHAARRHRNLLLDAGFADVTAEVRTGVFTDESFLPMATGLAEGRTRRARSPGGRPTTGSRNRPAARGGAGCSSPCPCSWRPPAVRERRP